MSEKVPSSSVWSQSKASEPTRGGGAPTNQRSREGRALMAGNVTWAETAGLNKQQIMTAALKMTGNNQNCSSWQDLSRIIRSNSDRIYSTRQQHRTSPSATTKAGFECPEPSFQVVLTRFGGVLLKESDHMLPPPCLDGCWWMTQGNMSSLK